MKTLYPVQSKQTRNVVCRMASFMARNHAHSDLDNTADVTPASVIEESRRQFEGFVYGLTLDTLTDNYTALRVMFMSAYISEYWQEYKSCHLKCLAREYAIDLVLKVIRIAM